MTAIAAGGQTRIWAPSFYTWTAVACMVTAFAGYIPTYWLPMSAGQFHANPVVHIHGAMFFTWTLYAIFQSGLVPARQVALHRSVGVIGVSFATALVLLGLLAALNSVQTGIAAGQAAGAEAFLIIPLLVIVSFAITFVLGVSNVRRPETHKRLMLLATVAVLNAPIARPLIVYVYKLPPTEQLPVWLGAPTYLISFLILAPAVIRDWRTRGSVHPVYLIGMPALLLASLAAMPISETAAWHAFAKDFAALAGKPPG